MYLLGCGIIFILFNAFFIWIDKKVLPNIKPFNCEFCLSVWVSIALTVCFFDVYLLSLPLIYRFVIKLIQSL